MEMDIKMSFNNYTWQLYKNNDLYRKTAKLFSTADGYSLLKEYNPYNARYVNSAQYNDWIDGFYKNGMASVIIEAKYYMMNNASVEQGFLQARSYALLLEATVIALCDKHFIYVYHKKGHFDRSVCERYSWQETNIPVIFNKLRKMFYT